MLAAHAHLFRKLVLRDTTRHRLLALLNVLSVALGVAVYLAIAVANHSATQSFAAGIDAVSGKSHLELRGADGRLEERFFPEWRKRFEIAAITPRIDAYAMLPDYPGEFLRLVGVDAFTNDPFRTFYLSPEAARSTAASFDLEAFLGRPRQVTVSPILAARYGWRAGEQLRIRIGGRTDALTIAGFNPEVSEITRGDGSRHLATMDIGWLQELLEQPGAITALQIQLREPEKLEAIVARWRAELPPGVLLETPSQRSRQVGTMLQGFQLNLTALSLVSILVGVFLIYNSVSASVVRRREEIGTLRSLGASRLQVQWLFLGEALLSGLLGTAIGLAAGIGLAGLLLEDVSKTITSLYVLTRVDSLYISPRHLVQGTAYGLTACLAGAWAPAREAARLEPASVSRRGGQDPDAPFRPALWLTTGLIFVAAAVLFSRLALTVGPPWFSFVACLALIVGFALWVPWFAQRCAAGLAAAVRHGGPVLWQVAASEFQRSLRRLSVTMTGLMVAIAMMTGVSIMIASFRTTVTDWLEQALAADLYIAPASAEVIGTEHFMPEEMRGFIESRPGVRSVESFRQLEVRRTDRPDVPVTLGVLDAEDLARFRFVGGDAAESRRRFGKEGAVWVSEPFLNAHGLSASVQEIGLDTPKGPVTFPVGGVFYDYTRDRGIVYLHRRTFDAYWDDRRFHSLAVHLQPAEGENMEAETAALTDAIRLAFGSDGAYLILSNRALRTKALAIFDQTFAVTSVLRTIAIVIAFLGVVLSLTTLVHERRRQIAVFRAIGASRAQVGGVYVAQATALGLASSVIGIGCGLGLAVILTWVLNKAFFGWTIRMGFPVGEIVWTPLWITATAAVAGSIPAWRAARASVIEAIRVD